MSETGSTAPSGARVARNATRLAAAVRTAIRIGLGALFAAAGALKLADPTGFAEQIANYQLLPAAAPYLAATLPAIEIVAGLALIAAGGAWRRAGALVVVCLSILFTIGAAWALARGVDVSCGCFGSASGSVTWVTLARNLGLSGAGAWLAATRA